MRPSNVLPLLAWAVAALAAVPLVQADVDLTATIADSVDPAEVGEVVTYTVTVANIGDRSPRPTVLDIYLPPGLPTSLAAYLAEEPEALAAYDALWEAVLVSESFNADEGFGIYWGVEALFCEGLKLQPQDFPLPAGASGEILFPLTMPALPVFESFVHASGPGLELDTTHFGRSTCDQDQDCVNVPCLGPRLSTIGQVSGALELVDDGHVEVESECISGTGTVHDGCVPFTMTGPGRIALVDRGCCAMEDKVVNASLAGAVAVVVADDDDLTDSTVEPDDVYAIWCTDFCSAFLVPTPAVFLSLADGQAVKAAMALGEVTLTLGSRETDQVLMTANIRQSGDYYGEGDDNDNWEETTTIFEEPVVEAPVASFTVLPTDPDVGETVVFTDTSSNGPTAWAWDFGDGAGSSAAQHPSYVYSAAGSYTVSLTASNAAGASAASASVVVSDVVVPPTLDHVFLVPAAARAAGAEGSFFVTELALNNCGTELATYQFRWLPRGVDNTEATVSERFTLAPCRAAMYDDLLADVFDLEDGAVGAIAVLADSPELMLMSRTSNVGDDGTFGQAIPGYASDELIVTGERRRILFFVENEEFRTNLGLLNGTGAPLRVAWERFAPDGTSLEVGFTDLPAWGNTQLNRVFQGEAPIRGGYLDVWTTTEGGAFAAYASLLDNQTSDPTTILPH